jgi:hypothetical protein
MRQHSISSQTKYVVAALVTGLLVVSMANSAYAGKGAAAGSGVNKGVVGSFNGFPTCKTHHCTPWPQKRAGPNLTTEQGSAPTRR